MSVHYDIDFFAILREFESRLKVFATTVNDLRSGLDATVRAEQSLLCDPQFDRAVEHALAANARIGVALESLYPDAIAFVKKQLEWLDILLTTD